MKCNLNNFGGRVLSILFAIFLTACGSGGGGGGGDPTPGGEPPTEAATTYKMAEYFPLGQGDTWAYTTIENGVTGSYTRTVNGTQTVNGVEAVKVIEDSGDYHLMTSDTNGLTEYGDYKIEDWGWYRLAYSPPINYFQNVISVGTKKTLSSDTTYTDSNNLSTTGTFSVETTVEGVEDATVPAGVFNNCLKIKFIFNVTFWGGDYTQSGEIIQWLAKGVGIVKGSDNRTVNNHGAISTSTLTGELISATVGGVSY
ncbi:MAG: hypothetical protein HZA14_08325 [Nitrospirae bacterium]|nr:hypothetical protein [Nitrospirota bacterium]